MDPSQSEPWINYVPINSLHDNESAKRIWAQISCPWYSVDKSSHRRQDLWVHIHFVTQHSRKKWLVLKIWTGPWRILSQFVQWSQLTKMSAYYYKLDFLISLLIVKKKYKQNGFNKAKVFQLIVNILCRIRISNKRQYQLLSNFTFLINISFKECASHR